MKKTICDKCEKEFSKKIIEELGYDLCKPCYNDFMVVVKDFFTEDNNKEPGKLKKIINKIARQEDLETPAYLRKKQKNKNLD
jgi:hypothetical protein